MNRTVAADKKAWFIVRVAVDLWVAHKLERSDYEECIDAWFMRCEEVLRRKFPETA